MGATSPERKKAADDLLDWAEAHIQIARRTLTIKLDRNLNSFQVANSVLPLSVADSAIATSAKMPVNSEAKLHADAQMLIFNKPHMESCLLGVHDLEVSWTSLDCVFLLPLILPLQHLRRRLCDCACIRLDMFSLSLCLSLSLSLSLSHYYLSMSLYISLSSLRVSLRMSLQKSERRAV
jgi:hypothetical protein